MHNSYGIDTKSCEVFVSLIGALFPHAYKLVVYIRNHLRFLFRLLGRCYILSEASSCIHVDGIDTKSCEVFVSLIGALLHTFNSFLMHNSYGIDTKSCEVFVSLIGALLHTFTIACPNQAGMNEGNEDSDDNDVIPRVGEKDDLERELERLVDEHHSEYMDVAED